jgi:hypothetical protein
LKECGEKYGWDAVEGLLNTRIKVYEKMVRKK